MKGFYEDLKESLEDILSFERGDSSLEFIEDTITTEEIEIAASKEV